MNYYLNSIYMEDVHGILELNLPWKDLNNKSIMVSGATGLIGSFLIDVIMEKNLQDNLNIKVYALVRNKEKALMRFSKYSSNECLEFMLYDVNYPLISNNIGDVDYVLHLASNTHPVLYATDPIGTITTNIIGVQNLLEFAVNHNTKRFVFASSNEAYGENRGDVDLFKENYCGYINCNTLRAGYPESKRCSEALCQAYKQQKGLDIVIPRVTRTYGPTMNMSDTKAISQFIKNSISGEDIVLKSQGTQFYSYTYVADAVSGLLYVLLKGLNGEAYNIAFEQGDILLKDLAKIIADVSKRKVIFDVPNLTESSGFSVVTKARLDGTKLKQLGWTPKYDIKKGVERTISILKSLR